MTKNQSSVPPILMFQFDVDDLTMKTGPQRVRAELPSLRSGWMQPSWFASPNFWLGCRSFADSLESDFDAVLWTAPTLARTAELPLCVMQRVREFAALV